MRILLVVHQYLPEQRAGTEVYTHSLARELSKRHEVVVYCHSAGLDGGTVPARTDSYERVTVRRVAAWLGEQRPSTLRAFINSYRNAAIQADYARYLEHFSPDVVHVQHLKDLSAGILEHTAERRIPIVMTLHDYWGLCPNAQCVRPDETVCYRTLARLQCAGCAAERLGRPLLKYAAPAMQPLFWARDRYLREQLAHVDRFIAPSAFLRERYIRAGLPAERILLLDNGLDNSRVAAAKGPRGPYRGHYAYVGSLAWQKGVHVLVEAFRMLGDAGATLRIWGSPDAFPDYAADLRDEARNCPWIQFEGAIHHNRVGEALAWADYLVVPSLWWENSPITICEAHAVGVPVIASRIGALPEKVSEAEGGLLFEPGDPESLLKSLTRTHRFPQLLDKLRTRLPAVQGMDEHAEAIEGIYRSVQPQK